MYLEHLELVDYRNYAELRLELEPGAYILAGDNAQGKSNICEAIRLLATMRSFRAGSERELIRWGAPNGFARVRALVRQSAGPLKMEIVISAPPLLGEYDGVGYLYQLTPPAASGIHKKIRVNDAPRRALDCVGLVTVVLFEPTDLDLVSGPPQGRRHFMDVTLCQISRGYCRALSQYQKILTQRAALLRRIRDNLDEPGSLHYWDEQLAQQAVPIIVERSSLITRCLPTADEFARQLGGKSLTLEYQPSFPIPVDQSVPAARGALMERLAALRKREIIQGVNLIGPHRDDLAFFEGPVNLGVFGSRGQQRTAALALKIAELAAIETETGDQPILVLDDVLSELDPTRQAALTHRIRTVSQVFLTSADPDTMPPDFHAWATRLQVLRGTVQPI